VEKWKRLLQEAQAAAKAAQDIAAKGSGENGAMTEAEREAYQAKFDEATRKKTESDQAKKDAEDQAVLKSLSVEDGDAPREERIEVTDRQEKALRESFGDRFVKSEAYEAFRKAHPSGVGSGSPVNIGRVKIGTMGEWFGGRKALTSPQANVQNIRMPIIDQVDRDRLTLLDLISRGQTGGNFEYVQITGVTRNAAIVPEATGGDDAAALKPVSDITTALADAKVYTYADGYDVTNQLLADAPAFASYMNTELRYSLDSVVEDKLLNGTGTSGEPPGILNTTGVQDQTYAVADRTTFVYDPTNPADVMALVKGIRRAITKVTRLGATVTAVVLAPEDDEAIDLLQDANDRFYGQGPFGSGPGTLWGRPRVTSERLAPGAPLLGDWRQVALLDREGLSVLAFNQHKDYAQRNMTYVRAELRAAQVLWKPNRLVTLTAA
jgi:HK97 family phage major capsid protein